MDVAGAIVSTVQKFVQPVTSARKAPMSEVDLTEYESVVQVYKFANTEIAKWTAVKDELNQKFKDMIGDSGYGTVNGARVLKVSTVKSSRFDTRLFKEDHPELHNAYLVVGEQRRLTLVKDEAETA